MNRFVLLLFLCVSSVTLNAQFGFGIKAGGGVATLHTTQGEKRFFHVTPSWHGGVFANYTINRHFLLQSTLAYTTKGYRDYTSDGAIRYNDYYRVNYIELTPLQFFYTPKSKDGEFLIGAGPTIGYGLGGKWREKSYMSAVENTNGRLIFLNDLKDYNGNITVGVYGKKIDFGGTISIGYQFKFGFALLLNGTGSILNIAPKYNGKKPDYTDRNIDLNMTVQYDIR
jgi:hypothetical protein